ncbi:MAG TPA: MFS transporter [Solirubrobacteraceae bacterium]|nr:MFS transporter [Solirubrobacteraceae bacterium]
MRTRANRDVRLLVTAVGLSAAGDFLVWVPLALHVEATSGSAYAVAAFFFVLFGPSVALAGAAGRLADRFENVRLLVAVSIGQAAVATALAFSTSSLAATLALSALLGAGTALSRPPESSLVPAAAAGTDIRAANGHIETARYAGMTVGPLLGGAISAAGEIELALLVNALSFLVAAVCAGAMHARRDPRALRRDAHDRGRLRDGAKHLTGDRVLRLTLLAAVGSLAFFSMSIAAEIIYVKDVLGAGDTAYGLVMATWMGGMVAGALTIARRVPAAWHAAGALAAIAVQGAGIAGATAGATLWAAFAGFALGGVAHGVKNVLLRTLIHERVPEAALGRAFAAYDGARNAAELTALAGAGVVVALLGPSAALLLAGGVPLAIGTIALLAVPRPPVPRPATNPSTASAGSTATAGPAYADR